MSVYNFFTYIRIVKNTDTKQRIIQTASELFYKNGYNSTGINEIIHESGIAKATLYNHFKSKEDLCLAYLRYMNTNFLNSINEFCTSKKGTKNQILAIFDFLFEFFHDEKFNGCWCIKTVAEIPKEDVRIRKEIQNQKEQFIQFINDISATHFKGKSSKLKTTKVKQIYLLYEGAVGESHLHGENWPIVEAKNICSGIL